VVTPLALLTLAVSASAGGAPSSVQVGGTPAATAHAASFGLVPPSSRLTLTVVLEPRDPAALAAAAAAVTTPGSPSYHHFLTPSQFAARFGARPAGVAAVRASLRSDGLAVGALAPNALSIHVSGTAAAVSHAFDVTLDRYRERSGRELYANVAAPRVPAALSGVIADVLGLNDLQAAVPEGLAQIGSSTRASIVTGGARAHAASSSGPEPCAAASAAAATRKGALTIDQVAKAYGMDGLYAAGNLGQGVTVALYELDPYAAESGASTDLAGFESCFGISGAPAVAVQSVDDGAIPPANPTAESAVDLQNLIGLAPAVTVQVYDGPNQGNGEYDTLSAIVNDELHHAAQVISDSWGICEADSTKTDVNAEGNLLNQAVMEGISVIASAGDRGAEGCATEWNNNIGNAAQQVDPNAPKLSVDDPASQPYVTGAGGTNLETVGPPPVESGWDQLDWGSTGGGISTFQVMPYWQQNAGVPGVINSYSSGAPCGAPSGSYCREVPDVSADGSTQTGYVTYFQGSWSAYGGTSASAPDWAALIALADASGSPGCPSPTTSLGFLNPLLYEVAAGDNHLDAFNDITTGSNSGYFDGMGNPFGAYPATPGYDMVTGLGTPIATDGASPGLVAQLCQANMTPPGSTAIVSSLSATEGATGSTITITGSGFTPFAAVWFGSTAASAVSYDSPTQLTATVPPGSGKVDITVWKLSGVSQTNAGDRFTYAPSETIVTPANGAAYTQGQSLTASYSCADSLPAPPTCTAAVANGGTIDTSTVGSHSFAVTGSDGVVSTTTTSTYTVVPPPVISITGLVPGATYSEGEPLSARVTCTTSAPVTIATCTAPGNVNTSAPGTHTFSIVATDSNGVTVTQVISYTVVVPPAATISAPRNGADYVRGQKVKAAFSCAPVAPARIVSCSASSAQGAALNTATLGKHVFTLTATDSAGATATTSVTYTVVASKATITGLRQTWFRWSERHTPGAHGPVGTAFSFSLDQAARVTLRFFRAASGRVQGGRCISPSLAVHGAQPCTRSVASGVVSLARAAGADHVSFDGNTTAGRLVPGSYTVFVSATGTSGGPSVAVSLHFAIVP